MIAMGRYFSKYAYASIVHNHRKIKTDTLFAVAGRWKHIIQKQMLPCIMLMFTRKFSNHTSNINRETVF